MLLIQGLFGEMFVMKNRTHEQNQQKSLECLLKLRKLTAWQRRHIKVLRERLGLSLDGRE